MGSRWHLGQPVIIATPATTTRPGSARHRVIEGTDPSAKATRRRDQRVLPGGVADLMNPQIRHHVTILKRYTATEEPRTPGTAPALSARTRYPHTASRWRTALPAKPARPRPAGRAGDPDRPAMYPGGTWQPPPVNLRRHRASPATTPAHPVLHERIVRQRPAPAGPLPVQPTLRSVTSIDAVQLTPSAVDSWRATWVRPSPDIAMVQRVRSPVHLITSPSIASRERWTLPMPVSVRGSSYGRNQSRSRAAMCVLEAGLHGRRGTPERTFCRAASPVCELAGLLAGLPHMTSPLKAVRQARPPAPAWCLSMAHCFSGWTAQAGWRQTLPIRRRSKNRSPRRPPREMGTHRASRVHRPDAHLR